MSTLTEQIAEAHEAHIFDKGIALCRCGVEMNTEGSRMREHRAHLATVTAAVVADWLVSDAITDLAATHSREFAGSGSAGVVVAEAIAAEARKGADQ